MSRPLTSRQEAFCRYFCATGNAADAARRAGYAAGSARQTGHDLLNRPWVIDRLRAIRHHWRQTAQAEAAILLTRLEQAWDVAVSANDGKGSAAQMLQVIRLQAEIAGLTRKRAAARADLWDSPGDEASGIASEAQEGAGAPSARQASASRPPLVAALRRGRDQAERALADHRRHRRLAAGTAATNADDDVRTLRSLNAAIDSRRHLARSMRRSLATVPVNDSLTNPDISGTHSVEPFEDALIDAAEAERVAADPRQPPNLSDSLDAAGSCAPEPRQTPESAI